MTRRGERGIRQRRKWEQTIRDDRDFAVHLDYTHFNPVKHGLVKHPDTSKKRLFLKANRSFLRLGDAGDRRWRGNRDFSTATSD
jgi:hypothetical protein